MGQPNDLNAAAMVAAAATATATATASVVALRDRNDQYGQVGGSTAVSFNCYFFIALVWLSVTLAFFCYLEEKASPGADSDCRHVWALAPADFPGSRLFCEPLNGADYMLCAARARMKATLAVSEHLAVLSVRDMVFICTLNTAPGWYITACSRGRREVYDGVPGKKARDSDGKDFSLLLACLKTA